jgi:hypothetical protein
VALSVGNWQQGTEQMRVSGRLNVLTHGEAGKGNAVLTLGPGKLSMDNSDMPLQLTGEAKLGDLIVYAVLPANLTGPLTAPYWRSIPARCCVPAAGSLTRSILMKSACRWPG